MTKITTEKRLEELLWIANQTLVPALRESIGTEYYEEIKELRNILSNSWHAMSDKVRSQIGQ
jgi:hypothetical protein